MLKLPRSGTNLGAHYNVGYQCGNTHGADDGTWDRGAYEYEACEGGEPEPPPSTPRMRLRMRTELLAAKSVLDSFVYWFWHGPATH